MTKFQTLILILIAILIIMLIYRYLTKHKLYFTSFHEEKKEFSLSADLLNNQILYALKLSNFKKGKFDQSSFNAITLPTIWSFSETIIVKVEKIGERNFLIIFKSTCFFPFQVFDWGKNERNAKVFYKNFQLLTTNHES